MGRKCRRSKRSPPPARTRPGSPNMISTSPIFYPLAGIPSRLNSDSTDSAAKRSSGEDSGLFTSRTAAVSRRFAPHSRTCFGCGISSSAGAREVEMGGGGGVGDRSVWGRQKARKQNMRAGATAGPNLGKWRRVTDSPRGAGGKSCAGSGHWGTSLCPVKGTKPLSEPL